MIPMTEETECPRCGQGYIKRTLVSGNTFGGRLWSDGKAEYPMMPDFPVITRCDHCLNYFWVNGSQDLDDPLSHQRRAGLVRDDILSSEEMPFVRFLTVDEYADALMRRKYKGARQHKQLRMLLWWAINDTVRDDHRSDILPEYTDYFEENLETLIRLSPTEGAENLLLQAEMHRELGLFGEALSYLSMIRDEEYQPIVVKMKDQIARRNRNVFLL